MGALAPPLGVAADSLPALVVGSAPPFFAVSLEAAPPVSPLLSDAALSLPPLDAVSSLAAASSLEVPSLDLAVEVVEVEVVCTAAFSALVSVGGVISGVLFGTASLTLPPPPQATRPTEQSSRMLAAITARPEVLN
ncbi:MAG TPA: hypothetical protein VGL54_02690 [Solirubrobacteraceae bacterium]